MQHSCRQCQAPFEVTTDDLAFLDRVSPVFHLVFNASHSEDCLYGEDAWSAKDCVDCTRFSECELCYDCTACWRCYSVQSSLCCDDCSESAFLLHCRSCRHCLGCVNLRHAQYCMFNEQCSKEEYERRLSPFRLGS